MSKLLVVKFGGTSLATPARVLRAAQRVRNHARAGREVVVIVSATGSTTDRILGWLDASAARSSSAGRERDRALATGEDLAAALLAAALVGLGVRALSLRGGEAGLEATGEHGCGELQRVDADRLRSHVAAGVVPVVAGFQAGRYDGETVTLGRGASDLTAVAVAAALGGVECHIVTDVDGVYDADPAIVPGAVRHDRLSHAELVRLTRDGASVVHTDAARRARRHRVPLRIYHYRSAPRSRAGTVVGTPLTVEVGRESRVVRVGLAGCGVVGGEFARILERRRDEIAERHGVRLDLVSVLVRRADSPRPVRGELLTTDVSAFLAAEPDIVVEALGGLEPAHRIARATLTRGARLVTANKALIAAVGDELARVASRTGGALDFEAAVGAGIPVVRVLRDSFSTRSIRAVRGILNGTCNHVLTAMQRGAGFADAVAAAQRLGFAESDPTRDLDGSDAADKIAILAWLAFGAPPAHVSVDRCGLDPNSEHEARAAAASGGALRLIAECARSDGGIVAAVSPVVVAHDSAAGRTQNEQNLVEIEFDWGGTISLSGPGAGAASTANALLGDVLKPASPVRPGTHPLRSTGTARRSRRIQAVTVVDTRAPAVISAAVEQTA